MEKHIKLKDGNLIYYKITPSYILDFISIQKLYIKNNRIEKTITFSMSDDFYFEAYSMNGVQNEFEFEFKISDPLYKPLYNIINLTIDDDATVSFLENYMTKKYTEDAIQIKFKNKKPSDKTQIFIKNTGRDMRSKIEDLNIKKRLANFFKESLINLNEPPKIYFNIFNECDFRNYEPIGDRPLLIRVLEPSYKKDNIPYKINASSYIDVLEFYLEDTISVAFVNENDVFNEENSKLLNDFILTNDFDEVVVHCSLGISRSPSIMICVSKILGDTRLENFISTNYPHHNLHIVNTFNEYDYQRKTLPFYEIEGNVLNKKLVDNIDDTEKFLE